MKQENIFYVLYALKSYLQLARVLLLDIESFRSNLLENHL